MDPNVEKVLDLIESFGYEETSYDKASFLGYYKVYMKKLLGHLTEKNADRVEDFKKGAKEFMEFIKANFEDLNFYTPKNYDT